MTEDASKGKNIVLCSDGTGNSGGKGNGTNVWRLYQAVDLSEGDQVAFHDDGVGTQDFKLLKAIGSATGFGLGANIRQLYASLVRVYDEGDRIYLFGFSRGAYTIRSLANFIHRAGVLDRHDFGTPEDLEREIRKLYDDYRGSDEPVSSADSSQAEAKSRVGQKAIIAFLGVWDTVDAIGVPFDELRDWLRIIPSLKDHKYELNSSIMAAFHALAIDDERQTFHPTLFDEKKRSSAAAPLEQVWFAGVHSNIGGGYPKDEIAYNSLSWMMEKAAQDDLYDGYVPLRFHGDVLSRYQDAANPHGKIYDSRSGPAAYYRVGPRDIDGLCGKANIDTPKIHASALVRITKRTGGYAPINIPTKYEVVDTNGQSASLLSDPGPQELGDSEPLMRLAKGLTPWRRKLYFTFLIVTWLLVLVLGWQMFFSTVLPPEGWRSIAAGAVKGFTPGFLSGAVEAVFSRVELYIGFVGIFGLLFWTRGFLKQLVRDLAGIGWRAKYLKAALDLPSANADPGKQKKRQDQFNKLSDLKTKIGKSVRSALAWALSTTTRFQKAKAFIWAGVVAIGVFLIGGTFPV